MKKKDARAVLEFRSAAQAMPNDPEPYYQLGMASLGTGDGTTAIQAFRKTLQLNPKHNEAQLKLSELMLASGRKDFVEQAAANLSAVITAAPDNPEALDAMMNTSSTAEVRATLDRNLRAQRLPAVVLQDGALRLVEKDYASARADGEEVLKGSPEDLTAALLIANSYAAERHVDKAIERLRQLAEARPNSGPLHLLLGEWLAQQKQTAEARKSFEAAKSADPGSRAADMGLARLDIEESKAGPARQRLESIVGAEPKNVPALLMLANSMSRVVIERAPWRAIGPCWR